MQLYSRASDQMNIHALLAVADAYYYGRGVKLDWRHAARLYEKASERSAQALFNLGYMHQYGAGLEQDLHLAKRCAAAPFGCPLQNTCDVSCYRLPLYSRMPAV